MQKTDYYPFGLAHAVSNTHKNKYLYNGKELQDELIGGTSLGLFDYGARFYDPRIGRWTNPDPLTEKYFAFSPYNYVINNPLKHIDPNGKFTFDIITKAAIWYAKVSTQVNNTIQAATNLSTGESGQINAPEGVVPQQTQKMAATAGTLRDIETVTEAAVSVIKTATIPVTSTIPGFNIAVEALSGQDISTSNLAIEAAAIFPIGKIGKLAAKDILRIQNAATRINKPITVVGSQASGKAGAYSDWDYVIEGLTNKEWKKIKNSLPGSKSILDNTSKNIDIIKTPLDRTKPHIIISPQNKK